MLPGAPAIPTAGPIWASSSIAALTTRGWAGRRAAYLVFAGYAVVLANFTVVNLFIDGKHSYSGL